MDKETQSEEIDRLTTELLGAPCLYIIEVDATYYKYGISSKIRERLHTHYRDLAFLKIVKVFNCQQETLARKIESRLGKFAENNDERVVKYDKTEIIKTTDIDKYVEFVLAEIKCLTADVANHIKQDKCKFLIVNQPTVIFSAVNNKKCGDCGKLFSTVQHLNTHKNRKTPCIIREISYDQLNSPTRCVHCNKTFSSKGNLKKHLQSCAIKIKGIKIALINETVNKEIGAIKGRTEQNTKEIADMREQIRQLKNEVLQLKAPPS